MSPNQDNTDVGRLPTKTDLSYNFQSDTEGYHHFLHNRMDSQTGTAKDQECLVSFPELEYFSISCMDNNSIAMPMDNKINNNLMNISCYENLKTIVQNYREEITVDDLCERFRMMKIYMNLNHLFLSFNV